jgi:hypothetical protein
MRLKLKAEKEREKEAEPKVVGFAAASPSVLILNASPCGRCGGRIGTEYRRTGP